MFVLGMNHHIEGRWDKARKYWEKAVYSPQCFARLASNIWYWIGYEQNNVGESGLEESVASFQRARESADGVRSFELQRLEIESRFFGIRRLVDLRDPEQRRQLYLLT